MTHLPVRWVRPAVVSAFLLCSAPGAWAQLAGGSLTDGSFAGGNGSLRDAVSSILDGPNVNTGLRPFVFSGAVDVEAGVSDSAGGVGGGFQPLFVVAPDFSLTGTTSRLNVALLYSPRLTYYPSTSSQSLLANTFSGTATATVVPDWLFLNVRGLTGITSRFGNGSLSSNSFISQGEAVQTSSFSVSPYLQHTFGANGTLTVGYTYARTFQDADTDFGQVFSAPNANATAGFGTTGSLATNSEYASYTTGENFGRVQDTISVNASQNSGDPAYQGSSTLSANNTVSYALYRWLTLLASVGYEEYNYPQLGYRLSNPTFSVGATITPNADSSITVRYGRTAGIDTILLNGTFAPTARTRIFGSYGVDIQTGLGARQNLLATTTVSAGGFLVDRVTGAPVLGNSYLASQFALSRIKTLTVGGILQLDRDTFTASVTHSQVTQLSSSTDVFGITTAPGTSTDSTFGTLGWQHDLNPSNSLFSSVSYGTSSSGVYFGNAGGTQDTFQLYTGLRHVFTDTLSGSVSFSHSERSGAALRNIPSAFGGQTSENVLLVGLRKSF